MDSSTARRRAAAIAAALWAAVPESVWESVMLRPPIRCALGRCPDGAWLVDTVTVPGCPGLSRGFSGWFRVGIEPVVTRSGGLGWTGSIFERLS
ncbi:hypothetical protein GCM10009664_01840 [Kitasatospora gansuensis]